MSFDYIKFVNEGYTSQQKYAAKVGEFGPEDLSKMDGLRDLGLSENLEATAFRYRKIIEHFGHLIEEAIEARVYVPRRSWKNKERSFLDSDEMRKEFLAEMYDVLLFHRAILAYAGVSGEEFAEVAAEKQAYNQTRKDHNINGTDETVKDPAAELQGLCPSAEFSGNNKYDRE